MKPRSAGATRRRLPPPIPRMRAMAAAGGSAGRLAACLSPVPL
ncbi:MAG: hypothetical protein OXU61_11390 [Gammaproteobacteria bacterium]|nr:hypothetical protein [Gammaproteobacteria bacterium]